MSNLNAPGFFSPEEIAQLRALWDDGVSSKAIGRIMGRTKNSILGCAHRLKLEPRPSPIGVRGPLQPRKGAVQLVAARSNDRRRMWGDADRAQLRELWAQGRSTAAIGEIMRRTAKSVACAANEIGLQRRPKPARPPRATAPKRARHTVLRTQTTRARPVVARRTVAGAPKQDLRFMVATVSTTRVAGQIPTDAPQAPVRLFDVPDDIPALREGCRWPMWSFKARPAVGDHLFCEAARYDTRHHYCPGHAERAFVQRGVAA
jgi:GcrA cell cycle regulator